MKKLLIIAIFALALSGCRNKTVTEREELVRVKVTPVVTGEMSIPVRSGGILVPAEEIRLSFKTGGIISRINVNEGSRVKKGELLASLDAVEINSAVAQARNGYEKALRDSRRAENLYADSVATLEMKENASTALQVAKSVLDAAEFNLKHAEITAPGNGIILKQLARQNELVAAGYPVFLFGSTGKFLKVRTGLADKDMVKVQPGDSAFVTFDAYASVKFPAVVDLVGEMADPYTGTFDTELLIEDLGYKLASGFVGEVQIFPSPGNKYTMVPVISLVGADGNSGYVFALTDSATVHKIKVVIAGMPGDMAAVSGIPAGIRNVVTEGAAYLKDGMKVIVVK
ncbi:MAG TPA: efflux RND transporter periplasmic adaptor subunit [Bacteroidales bacterium]|nr:efflux RND transporter periplasmic adaptor subunit [Bacteroidales bacterium]